MLVRTLSAVISVSLNPMLSMANELAEQSESQEDKVI